jgi:hypothetical protein
VEINNSEDGLTVRDQRCCSRHEMALKTVVVEAASSEQASIIIIIMHTPPHERPQPPCEEYRGCLV